MARNSSSWHGAIGRSGPCPTSILAWRRSSRGGASRQLDLSQISAIDSAGAWLISRSRASLEGAGLEVTTQAAEPAHEALIDKIVAMGVPPPANVGAIII